MPVRWPTAIEVLQKKVLKIFPKIYPSPFAASINAEYRSGQLAGLYVDHKQITHSTLEGMSRDQLEKRLEELESKIGEAKNIIDVTPETK